MSGRVILITGANSGFGFAAARVLVNAPESFHVVMTGRSLERIQSAKSEIEASDPSIASRLSALQLDVTDSASIQAAAEQVFQRWGHLDVLINNAASGNTSPDTKTRFQATMETNVTGPAVVTSTFRPLLLKSIDKPYSIFVSSGAGSFARTSDTKRAKAPSPANPNAYHASKAALNMIALLEHMDYGSQIKVFAMTPGFVVSNLRGTSEEMRTGFGKAGDPIVAAETLLSMIRGERDGDVGRLVHKDGVYEW